MSDEPADPLEKILQKALHGQPLLRAPATLELRVRAQIAMQASRPWWRRSFKDWPGMIQASFVVLAAGAACISVAGTLAVINGPFSAWSAGLWQEFSPLRVAAGSVAAAGAGLLETIPPAGWYLGAVVLASASAGVLGLGATAYRLLWRGR